MACYCVIYISTISRLKQLNSYCVAQIKSRVKGHHVYDYKYTVNEELICIRDDKNIHSDNAIKVLSKVEKKQKKGCN